MKKLALGTVQFGLSYGIANQHGQVGYDDAMAILAVARASGMETLDTAIAYGQSEERLGAIGVSQWQIVSKLPPIPAGASNVTGWVDDTVNQSLRRLDVPALYGLLLHHPQQLLECDGARLYDALQGVKRDGRAKKIGVSIYDPSELDALWPRFTFDLVQAPFNVIDRRLATSGWLAWLHGKGTEVHVRSVFLQGLLLMDASKRPASFRRWDPLWKRWGVWLDDQQLTAVQGCLRFAISHPEIDRVVVGVDSLTHLNSILADVHGPTVAPPASLMSVDADLINPSRWGTS